ncbi:MAG: hypothetical protein J6T10_11395 [Methanobrevibacter sp.]|nr:hypothetical protein [Methanobrevibacter sp.]
MEQLSMTNIMEQEKQRSFKEFMRMLKKFSEMYNQMLSDEDKQIGIVKQIEIISLASSLIKAVGEMEIRCEYCDRLQTYIEQGKIIEKKESKNEK